MLSRMWYDWDLFDTLMNEAFGAVPVRARKGEAGIGYEFDMPGIPEDAVDVTLENGVLTVKGERDGRTMIRSITLPRGLDSDRLEARYVHGVLQIVAPYAETAKPKRIEVTSSDKPKELG